jgi:hypothetical protein
MRERLTLRGAQANLSRHLSRTTRGSNGAIEFTFSRGWFGLAQDIADEEMRVNAVRYAKLTSSGHTYISFHK